MILRFFYKKSSATFPNLLCSLISKWVLLIHLLFNCSSDFIIPYLRTIYELYAMSRKKGTLREKINIITGIVKRQTMLILEQYPYNFFV